MMAKMITAQVIWAVSSPINLNTSPADMFTLIALNKNTLISGLKKRRSSRFLNLSTFLFDRLERRPMKIINKARRKNTKKMPSVM